MQKRLISLFISIYCLSFMFLSSSYAAENEAMSFDFSVEPLLSDKQIDKEQRYFNLRLSPNETEIIYIKITNHSETDAIYEVNINQAYTSKNGFIEYNKSDEELEIDPSLKYDINDIVVHENLVLVPANSEKNVPITITMPPEEFQGIILSGIIVEKFEDSSNNKSESLITNRFNYVVGLTISETDDNVKREIVLKEVYPDISFGKTSIVAKLSNPKMESYGHLKYSVSIICLDTEEEFISQEYDNGMEFAPNSIYKFAIDANDKVLIPGNYELNLSISDKKGNNWDFNEEFEITKQEAKRINKAALVDGKANRQLLFISLGILVGLSLFLAFIYLRKKWRQVE